MPSRACLTSYPRDHGSYLVQFENRLSEVVSFSITSKSFASGDKLHEAVAYLPLGELGDAQI